MDGGASILAFVLCGLKSIKLIHGVISSVKDGPPKLSQLEGAISSLHDQLEQMRDDPTLPTIPPNQTEALKRLLERCNADIGYFEKKISKLSISDDEKLRGKLWKRLRLAFAEKDIPFMLAVISGHVDSLSLQANIRQTASLAGISSQNAHIKEAVDSLVQKATEMPSISSTQATEISTGLAQLTQLCGMLATKLTNTAQDEPHNVSGSRQERDSPKKPEDSEILRGLEDLARLVDESERTIASEEAEDVVDALDSILRDMASKSQAISRVESRSTGIGSNGKLEPRQFKIIAAHFVDALSIRLNSTNRHHYSTAEGTVRTQGMSFRRFEATYGTATLTSITRTKRQKTQKEIETSQADVRQEITTTVAFMTKNFGPKIFIKASAWRGSLADSCPSLAPCVSISWIRPNDSEVFRCIQDGRLDTLQQLLRDGMASLQDRDEYGASLLHHAYKQPDITAFLLQNGADVNDIASTRNVPGYHSDVRTPICLITCMEPESLHLDREQWIEGRLRGFRHMLAAGADLTLTDLTISPNPFFFAYFFYPHELIRAILDEAIPFFDLHDTLLCQRDIVEYAFLHPEPRKIKLLIPRAKASTQTVNTSLLRLLPNIKMAEQWSFDFESIKYLISLGSDVRTVQYGLSCSDVAYRNGENGSWCGDVWDAALAACGYDVLEFRKGYPRKVCYIGRYTRVVFEEVWRGMESFCPYYDDQDWYPEGSAEIFPCSNSEFGANGESLWSDTDEEIQFREGGDSEWAYDEEDVGLDSIR